MHTQAAAPNGSKTKSVGFADHSSERILHASRRAWPAEQGKYDRGWYLRASLDRTKRANSVWPLVAVASDTLDERIDQCEYWYRDRGQLPLFFMPDLPDLRNLAESLQNRRYVQLDASIILHAEIDADSRCAPNVHLEHRPVALVMNALLPSSLSASDRKARANLFNAIRQPKCFAIVCEGDLPVAGGMAVVDNGLSGIFNMHTHAPFRGRGYARTVLDALMRWSRRFGCKKAYIQVEKDNRIALDLYAKRGFSSLLDYVYWIEGD